MTGPGHGRGLVDQLVVDALDVARRRARGNDERRALDAETWTALNRAGLFRMAVPAELGGSGLAFRDACPVVERVARADGSAGWSVGLGIAAYETAVRVGGPRVCREVFGDPAASIAGTLNPSALRARRVDGGWLFTGRAAFLSGSSHAQWVALGGLEHDGEHAVRNDDGSVRIRLGVVPIDELSLEDVWHVSGLRATASNDAELRDLFIPDDRSALDPPPLAPGPGVPVEAAIPRFSVFARPIAHIAIGAARGALDALIGTASSTKPMLEQRTFAERPDVQLAVARAQGLLDAASATLSTSWDELQASIDAGRHASDRDLATLRIAAVTATELAREAVDLVFDVAGSSAIFVDRGIERGWRDTHAASRHVNVAKRTLQNSGRLLLGVELQPRPVVTGPAVPCAVTQRSRVGMATLA